MTANLATLLSNNHGIRVFCDACKRVADIDVEAIALKYGRGVTLTEIGAKARCNRRYLDERSKDARGLR